MVVEERGGGGGFFSKYSLRNSVVLFLFSISRRQWLVEGKTFYLFFFDELI